MLKSNTGHMGIGVQSAKGTEQATPEWYPKIKGSDKFTSDQSIEHLREEGDGELVGAVVKTGAKEKFGFDLYARPEAVARIFAYLLGSDTLTGASDPYTHTIVRSAANGRAWLTIHRKIDDGVVQILKDAKIAKITCKGESGKPVEFSVEGDALSSSLSATETVPAYETLSPFVFYDGAGRFTVGASIYNNIKSFQISVSIANEVLQGDALTFYENLDQRLDIDVQLQFFAEDTDFFDKSTYYDGTTIVRDVYTSLLDIDLQYVDSGSITRRFRIQIPKFEWKPAAMVRDMEGKASMVTLAGIAVKPDSGEIITVTAINDVDAAIYNT